MSCGLWKIYSKCLQYNVRTHLVSFARHGHHLRGKPPGIARCLQERLDELNYKDPELTYRVDISLPPNEKSQKEIMREKLEVQKKNRHDPKMEKESRERTLRIDMNRMNDEWLKSTASSHLKMIADHYGIFEHLFGDAYFFPRVPLKIHFSSGGIDHPVYYGNVLKPSEATEKPKVSYDPEEESLWTLILTNPDGHFTDNNSEYLHWFIGNIPGNNLKRGEVMMEYLQPFPPLGTGYHRHVFILYKQEKKLDFLNVKASSNPFDLKSRTFSNLDFYRKFQDDLTPAGLAFFQSDWDKSLTKFYHEKLNMKEPVFEYDFDPAYLRPQKWFPLRQPFNLYMDKYRDPMQINKEFLVRKLKNVHPFKPAEKELPYPNAYYFNGYVPSWLKLEIRKSKLKWGRINDIE